MKTKTIIIIIAALCLVFAAYVGITHLYESPTTHEPAVNFDKLYKAYDPDVVVANVGDESITWDRYYNVYAGYAQQIEYYMTQMKTYYGTEVSWDDVASEDGSTFAMQPKIYAEDLLKQSVALKEFAVKYGTTYDETDTNSVSNIMDAVYGLKGEKVADEDAVSWMEDQGYIHAKHILFMTVDRETGEAASEDEIKEKEELAQQIYEELTAIEDKDEMLAKFEEYFESYNEDTGEAVLINGYTFLNGSMYQEFTDAALSLNEYEVSGPVKTNYGVHLILRLPLDPEEHLFEYYANGDEETTGRLGCAYDKFDTELTDIFNSKEITYKERFKLPEIKDYIR